jgi:hypothetical protein
VQALENTKYHKHLAEKVENCHKRFRHKRCDQNHDWASTKAQDSCAVRLCPHCAHRRSNVMAARIQSMLVGRTGLRYLVLAERNCENLQEGICSLWVAWTKLRRSVAWKRKVKGCIVVLEVTKNVTLGTWHPHLNVLMEGEYFPFAELNQAWMKATGGNGRTSHIQAANETTVYELLKYTLKVAEKDEEGKLHLIFDQPEALDEFLSAVYGSRLVRAYGVFHGLKLEDEDEPEEEACPDCGSTCFVDMGSVLYSQLAFDFEKEIFRPKPASARDRALHFVRWSPPRGLSTSPEAIAIAIESRKRATSYERAVAQRFAA